MYTNNMANRIYALDKVLNRERERTRENESALISLSLALSLSRTHKHIVERNYAMDYAFDWGNRVAPKKKRFGIF